MFYHNKRQTICGALFAAINTQLCAAILLITSHNAAASFNNDLVTLYNETHWGDLSNVAGVNKAKGNFGTLPKGSQLIIIGDLDADDYRDSIYFETEEPFTVRIIEYSGESKQFVTFGFGPEFPQFPAGVETVIEPKTLYQGKKLQAGGYRFDFGAPGGPGPNQAIDAYAVHISVDSGLEALSESSLRARIGNGQYFLRPDDSAFLMENNEWSDIELFLASTTSLPSSDQELQNQLPIHPEVTFNNHFVTMREQYAALREDALRWEQQIYPGIIATAQELTDTQVRQDQFVDPIKSDLASLKDLINNGAMLTDPIEKQLNQQAIQQTMTAIIDKLASFEMAMALSVTLALTNSTESTQYSSVMTVHHSQIKALNTNFSNLYLLAEDNSLALANAISQLNQQISDKNKQIDDKQRRLALSAIGGGLSAAIAAAILVPQINALKRDRDSLINQRNNKQNQLNDATLLYEAYGNAQNSLNNTQLLTVNVLPYFNHLKLQWQSLHTQLSTITELLNTMLSESETLSLLPNTFYDVMNIAIESIATETTYISNKNQNYIDYVF